MLEQTKNNRLVVVSNRLPVVVTPQETGQWSAAPGAGGLITALAPVLRDRGGLWIGWPGIVEEKSTGLHRVLNQVQRDAGYELEPVLLTDAERDEFYYGFSNEVIWPLFHDMQTLCNFNPAYWRSYEKVNRKFADAIARKTRPGDFIWVHDYHLMSTARYLRDMGVESRLGFFLHIPFPPLDIFIKMPWRFQLLSALLEYDLIGLQTLRDRRNFVQCLRLLVKDAVVRGKGQVITVNTGGRQVRLGVFPIGIDYDEFAKHAASQEVAETAWYLHEDFPERKIVLGVDRLDYTKGIPYKLEAFRNLLTRYPEMRKQVTLVQILVPSRAEIPQYRGLKESIERLVGEINGQFAESDWIPIHYIFRSVSRTELLAYYRSAEMALVTPLKDGMNLVAKEFCASNIEEQSVLILSEFAGAVAQFQRSALLVNPYDVEGMAETVYRAFNMSPVERRKRMKSLRRIVRRKNIYWWVDSFLRAAIARNLRDFPVIEDYLPQPQNQEVGDAATPRQD
jgi:trehalose 6-phosphate synthase/phosphatase